MITPAGIRKLDALHKAQQHCGSTVLCGIGVKAGHGPEVGPAGDEQFLVSIAIKIGPVNCTQVYAWKVNAAVRK